jgi:hypothetical protein
VTRRAAPWWLLYAAALAGCDAPPPTRTPGGPCADAAADFNADATGTIAGAVTWDGDPPAVPLFLAPVNPLSEAQRGPRRPWPNPNAPVVAGRGVGNAVVFLRGVDPRRARKWDHPPAHIELRDYQIHVVQGDADGPYGVVRRGDAVEIESKQAVFHSIEARGAAFFALAFPQPDPPRRRRVLDRAGVVELSSGAGQFWMRAYLFVDDHPYYARTDAAGGFTLSQVPPGDYDLVCWLPDWREASHELDADTCLVSRLTFRPPLQVVQHIRVESGRRAAANFTLSQKSFDP